MLTVIVVSRYSLIITSQTVENFKLEDKICNAGWLL